MRKLDLSINEIDGLLEQLYKRLKGKKEGLSLIEPSVILLQALKASNSRTYTLYLRRFSPVIIDALISRADRAFGFDGLQALLETTRDISVISEDYTPDGLSEGIESVKAEIDMIKARLRGESLPPAASGPLRKGPGASAGRLFPEKASASVSLPLVSIYKTGSKPLTVGRVMEPRVELRIIGEWSMRRAEKPVITFTHMSAEPNGDFEKQIFLAVRLAERFAAKEMNLRDISRIPREYRFSIPETAFLPASILGMMKGGSAGLALTTMVIAAIGRLGLSSRKYESSLSTAYTGMLDEEGRVLPVDDAHIKDKVYAAFFSTCDTLVAPTENIKTAEAELSRLREDFTARKLRILPATDVSSTCKDTAVSACVKTSAAKIGLRRMFHWRKHLLAGIMGVASLILLLLLYTRYSDNVAITAKLVGQDIVFTNKHGADVNKYCLGFETESKSEAESQMYTGDFDNDGKEDFFYVYLECRNNYKQTGEKNQAHLLLFDQKGALERHLVINPADSILDDAFMMDQAQNIRMPRARTIFKNDAGDWIYLLLIQHPNLPSTCIIQYDFIRNRSQLFFHYGYLHAVFMTDLDLDGKLDIIASGYNPLLKSGVIMTLDPENMEGTSPACASYDDPRYSVDIARYYIKLPHFFRFTEYLNMAGANLATHIQHSADSLFFEARSKSYRVHYSFGKSLICNFVDITHKNLVNGPAKIDYDTEGEEAEDLRRRIEYWDGSSWVKEPTINKSYLDYVSSRKSGGAGSDE